MAATVTTTEVFPATSASLADVQDELRLRIKAGAIRSSIDQSDPSQLVLSTEWNVLGQNNEVPGDPAPPPAQGVRNATLLPASFSGTASAEQNVVDLAWVIMSEASVGNAVERLSVASTVVNRMTKSGSSSVRAVWRAYSHAQQPVSAITALARDVLGGQLVDPTNGCTHYYSPRSMPVEGRPVSGFDVTGGLELVPPLTARTYVPGWARTMALVTVSGVRPDYFKFYKS